MTNDQRQTTNNERPVALVTGASSGIGLQYATQLARDYHYDLLLVSNQQQELDQVAKDMAAQYGVRTYPLYMDLSLSDAAEQVYQYCQEQHLFVEVLINNAGMLIFDAFCSVPMARIETLLMLHVLTATKLCRLFAPQMCERQHGFILNMSSMSAWMAMPSIVCYNASKSYLLNFSRALWYELLPQGVHVLAVTPGSTDTGLLPFGPGFARFLRRMGITMPPERLVHRALRHLFYSRRKRSMPGAWNHLIVPIINHLPDWLVFAAMRRIPMFRGQ